MFDNLFQMDIDCIVYQEGTMPEVKRFCPDPDFDWDDDDKPKLIHPNDRLYPKMTVLNYKDTHFNLVVEKSIMIAQSGTFTFQREMAGENISKNITTGMAEMERKVKALTEALVKGLETKTF